MSTYLNDRDKAKKRDQFIYLPVFILFSCISIFYIGKFISTPVFNQEKAKMDIYLITGHNDVTCNKNSCFIAFENSTEKMKSIIGKLELGKEKWERGVLENNKGRRYVILEHTDDKYRYRMTVGEKFSAFSLYNPKNEPKSGANSNAEFQQTDVDF
ncbi:hypothetical protein [Deinococcus aquaticus]|uniref:hypothetical protein n=1 Tax=Deinococcus aquaticus TaxID=328692 RepID=UPI003F4524E1